jgi:hypothetical protein
MTLKEFIVDKNITGFELVGATLINVLVDNIPYGLDSDTTNIIAGTLVENITEWSIVGDILTINGIEYDMNIISLL